MPSEELYNLTVAGSLKRDDNTGMVMLPVSAAVIENNREMMGTSPAWLSYLRAEKQAKKGIDEGAVEAALEEIRQSQLAYAEKLESEGRLDEAIELLGLSPADAAALMKQVSDADKEADLAAMEEQRIEDNERRTRLQNTLLAGSVLAAAAYYLYKRRK